MAKIEYAAIRFLKYYETEIYVVHIDDIKLKNDSEKFLENFEPKDENDFEKDRGYYIKWNVCDEFCTETHKHYDFYKANILLLGVTTTDVHEKLKAKRVAFSNQKYTQEIGSSSTPLCDESEDDNGSDSSEKNSEDGSPTIKSRKKIKSEVQERLKQKILEKKRLQSLLSKRIPLDDAEIAPINNNAGINNDGESDIEQHGRDEMPKRTVTRKTHGERGTSTPESLRTTENGQNENNAGITGTPRSSRPTRTDQGRQVGLNRIRNSLFQNNDRNMNQENDERPIHLGLDVYVDEDVWDYVLARRKKTLFLRSAAELIWKPYHLANRCFRPSKTRFTIPGRSPRKKIEKDKLNLLNRVYDTYLDVNNYKGSRKIKAKKKVRKILQRKIQDLRKNIDLINKLHEENPNRTYLTTGLSSP